MCKKVLTLDESILVRQLKLYVASYYAPLGIGKVQPSEEIHNGGPHLSFVYS